MRLQVTAPEEIEGLLVVTVIGDSVYCDRNIDILNYLCQMYYYY